MEELSRKKFRDLSEAEERVVRAASDGTEADCRLGGGSDPEKVDTWPATRNVRADLIRWLCIDRAASEQVDPKGIQIQGARITEPLDLSFTNVPFPLVLSSCRLEQDLNLKSAKMPLLSLQGSWTGAIDAEGLKLEGDIFLRKGFNAEGEVSLIGATIGGDLSATGGTFKNLKSDKNPNPTGYALSADRIKVTGGVYLRNGFSAEGAVALLGATIGGNLDATGGTFKRPNGNALNPDGTKNETALNADRVEVAGGVFLRNGFHAEGEVRLVGAAIGGNLNAEEGTFRNPAGNSLNADGIKVSGDVFLNNGFSSVGEVRLLGAEIGGNLDAEDGTFKSSNEDALSADGIKVSGDVFLSKGFRSAGNVRLLGAKIDGQLEVDDAWLDLLNLDSAHITGRFLWQNIHKEPESYFPNKEWKTSLDLTNAKVGSLADQAASWPEKGRLRLDGFVYDRITAGPDAKVPTDARVPVDATARLRWLHSQPDELGFRPQPYEQLIAVLRQMGYEHQIAKVAVAKQTDLYEYERSDLGRWGKFWSWFLYRSVRYGYEPWRAFIWMAILVLAGSIVFSIARLPALRVMVPSDQGAYESDETTEKAPLPHYYPQFHAFVYSIDVILPFDLGQKSHWRLHERRPYDFVYWLFEFYSLLQLFVGWVLLLVAAAVPAGFIKED
ncbi:hypothetical protein [Candidatus Binatus sp.]|uniref:hypothetical protein n=1 Tax=Candidatus Binatus sp. TaxID=2811406 RepID=UPI003BCFCBCF